MDKVEFKRHLEDRLINFAVLIIKIVKELPDDRVGNHLGGQLLRSGTSPSLNYGEALGAESRKDFLHKIGIVLKELRESLNCLKILSRVGYLKDETVIIECNELISIFVKSAQTIKSNMSSN
jgi:four helix bundle protein